LREPKKDRNREVGVNRKIALLIPVYNDREGLRRTLEGLPWEVPLDMVVVDDGAEAFPTWEVHLIGYEVSVRERLSGNVKAHGFLSFSRYVPILADADVGIGALALHRNRMNEASPLKVREYLALGLPAIIGYEDTDFPDGAPFLLCLPNEESNIECCLGEVQRFVVAWVGKRVLRQEVSAPPRLLPRWGPQRSPPQAPAPAPRVAKAKRRHLAHLNLKHKER